MRNKFVVWAMLVALVFGGLLAACEKATPTPTEAPTQPPAATEAPAKPTEAPTPTPMPRMGAWVDEVTFITETDDVSGYEQVKGGLVDVYAFTIGNPDVYKDAKANPDVKVVEFFGVYNELTFNTYKKWVPEEEVAEDATAICGERETEEGKKEIAICEFDNGKLNPFGNKKIREAMNWIVDRDYIAREIMGGLATPKYLPITSAFPDYARYIDVVRKLEATYAYNFEKAKEVVTAEMEAMGAVMNDEGIWTYKDEPVELVALIRVEDERKEIGDYFANQLEQLGFKVKRHYGNFADLGAFWIRGNPAEGTWHSYTGGWITTAVDRDQGDNFEFFYTERGLPIALWQTYDPNPEFDEIAKRLANNEFKDVAERDELFRKALELAVKESVRIWLVDQKSFSVVRKDIHVAYDLAGGISGAVLWPYTLRREGQVGGSVTWLNADVLSDVWNPIGGSDAIYDMQVIRALGDWGVVSDPFTGLAWPQRIERAEVVAQTGTPITKTLDWVTLDFQDEIVVPDDAWVDWDAKEQRFITAAEKGEKITARIKSVVYYPEDLYEKVKWHDGSNFDLADIVMGLILTFDRGKEDSAIFDESYKGSFDSFMTVFKGVRIVSEKPLVIEYYTDAFQLDAELTVSTLWPQYDYGEGSWHMLAIGILAEEAQELAFTADKADALGIEWMNYIAGPSLEILAKYLDQAASENYIPYANTLGQYITEEEAKARWENYKAWYEKMGHFWVGTGPFYLDKVFPVEKTVTIKRFEDYSDPADKWLRFSEPKLADVTIEGPARVRAAEGATFDVMVTFQGEPYPADEIMAVKYLLFDAEGNVVATGDATLVEDGHYAIELTSDVLADMGVGAARIEVAVTSKVVSIPSLTSVEFLLLP